MAWPYEVGRIYNRRQDIHRRYRGQQQGGIVTPAGHPVVFIISGAAGRQHGYHDRYRDDGAFEYFGEGQVGDMELIRGNRSIADHSADGKSLLLFEAAGRGHVRFMGEWICENVETREGLPDRNGTPRNALVFILRPLEALNAAIDDADLPVGPENLDELRRKAMDAASQNQAGREQVRNVYDRSRDVRRYILQRANGTCEGCENPAPFVRADGSPYLEPHHIRRVSDGGPDHPRHVIALCPTCHRRVHHGRDGREYNDRLDRRMAQLEPHL